MICIQTIFLCFVLRYFNGVHCAINVVHLYWHRDPCSPSITRERLSFETTHLFVGVQYVFIDSLHEHLDKSITEHRIREEFKQSQNLKRADDPF